MEGILANEMHEEKEEFDVGEPDVAEVGVGGLVAEGALEEVVRRVC